MRQIDIARALYTKYGRTDRQGRIFVSGEYVGYIDRDKGYGRVKGQTRGLVIPSTDPADVVCAWMF